MKFWIDTRDYLNLPLKEGPIEINDLEEFVKLVCETGRFEVVLPFNEDEKAYKQHPAARRGYHTLYFQNDYD